MVNPNINPQEEGLEQERLEEEPEQAPLVLPPATPGGPPEVLPRGVAPPLVEVVVPVSPGPTVEEIEGEIKGGEIKKEGIKEVNGEDLSDLFDVSTEDVLGDTEEGLDDLVEVSEEDVMGEGGADMSDLTSVSYKEVSGYDYLPPKRKREVAPQPPRVTNKPSQTSMGGLQE